MPQISVIVPVYNKEKYLEKSLQSVLSQSFQDLEVIAVNDGSTDQSLKILKNMQKKDSRIRIINIHNGGVSNARNVGLQCAAGKWIQFLDADDCLAEHYLHRAVQIAEKERLDILFSNFTMVDLSGKTVRSISASAEGIMDQNGLCRQFMQDQNENGFFGYISNKLFSKELLRRSGAKFPVGTTLAEDLHFYVKLYPAVERAYFWQGNSFYYLQTDENYMLRTTIDYYSQIAIHLDVKRWFCKSQCYEVYQDKIDEKITQYAYFILFHDNEAHKDLKYGYSFLRKNSEILKSLNPICMEDPFARKVLSCVQNEKYSRMCSLFAGRNIVRKLYRMVKKNG